MSEADALRTVRDFLGDDRLSDPERMAELWKVTPYEDAWLVRPKSGSRGGHLFLVRGQTVEPFQFARSTLDAAYARLVERSQS